MEIDLVLNVHFKGSAGTTWYYPGPTITKWSSMPACLPAYMLACLPACLPIEGEF